MTSFLVARERDAWPTIRGFVFQVEQTLDGWIDLGEDELLELECGEDIDHVARALRDGSWREERVLGQIKSRESRLTLRDGSEALANFAEHRQTNCDNPHLRLKFRFTTNAAATVERPAVLEPSHPDDAKRSGIELWKEIYEGRILGDERVRVLAALKAFLVQCAKPDDLNPQTWANWQQFLVTSNENEWLDFVQNFDWGMGTMSPLALRTSIEEKLIQKGATPEQARLQYERLFVHVFSLLSHSGSKKLEADAWRSVATIELEADALRWLDQLQTELGAMELRVHAVEMRTEAVEDLTQAQSTQLRAHDRRLAHQETASHEILISISNGQDANEGHFAFIKEQLAQLRRTPTFDKNSPEARAWNLELLIEEKRHWVDGGKVRTARKELERLKGEVESLEVGEAKNQLLSRVLTQLAFCDWRENHLPEAAQLYFDALGLEPENPKRLANAAFGALLIEEWDKALALSEKAIHANAASEEAISAMVRALYNLGRAPEIEDVVAAYPEAVKGLQALATLGGIALADGDEAAAIDYGRQACLIAPDNPNAQRLLGDALLLPIQRRWRSDPPILLRFPAEQRAQAEEAEAAYSRAIELMEEWEVKTVQSEVLCNRAGLREMLGRVDEAMADCEAALAVAPTSETALFTKGEILLHHRYDPEAAIPWLERVRTGHLAEDAAVLHAEARVVFRQWPKVIEILEPIYRPAPDRRDQIDLARLLGQAYFFSGDKARFLEIKAKVETVYAEDVAAWALLADFAQYEGDFGRYRTLMEKVVAGATGEGLKRATFLLAHAHALNEEFDEAVPLLRSLLDAEPWQRDETGRIECPDMVLRYCLQLMGRSDRHQDAHDLAQQMRRGRRAISGISEFEATHAEQQGDLARARRLLEELSEDNPLDVRHARNAAALRLGEHPSPEDIEIARTILRRVSFDQVKDRPRDLMDVARLCQKAGFAHALEWAYQAARRAPNDAIVSAVYLQYIFIEVPQDDARLPKERVEGECAVEVKRRRRVEAWLLTNESSGDPHEIPLTSEFAQSLMGKVAGDRFSLTQEQPWNRDGYEVLSVRSKYIYLAHEINHKIESGILRQRQMVVGHFTSLDTVEGALEERETLREMIESGTSTAQIYGQYAVPLATIAQLSAVTVFDLWRAESPYGGYRVESGRRFYVSLGTAQEWEADAAATSAMSVVLDATALVTIVHLELEAVVVAYGSPLLVARPLADEVNAYYVRQQRDDLDFEEGTPQDQNRRDFARRLKAFVETHCQVERVAAWTPLDEERTRLHGRGTIATLKLAQEKSLPVLADDLRVRRMVQERYQTSSFGLQNLLDAATERGLIGQDVAFEALRRLLIAHYGYLRLDREFLPWLMERNNFEVTAEVRRILRGIATWPYSDEFMLRVASDLLSVIFDRKLLHHRRTALISLVLHSLVEGRAAYTLIEALKEHLVERFPWNTQKRKTLSELIKTWESTQLQIVNAQELLPPSPSIIRPPF